jgi:RHS repeat-associated protein
VTAAAKRETPTAVPEGLLALAANSHRGHRRPAHTLHEAIAFSKPMNATGLPVPLYDFRGGPRCTGKERDTESALDYFGARYFSGAQGRFTSPDPLTASAEHAVHRRCRCSGCQDEARQGVAGLAVGALGAIEQILRGLYRRVSQTRPGSERLEKADLRGEPVECLLVSHPQAPEFVVRVGNLSGHNYIDARKSKEDQNSRQGCVVGQALSPVCDLGRGSGGGSFPARLVSGSGVRGQVGQHVLFGERAASLRGGNRQGCVRLRRQQQVQA